MWGRKDRVREGGQCLSLLSGACRPFCALNYLHCLKIPIPLVSWQMRHRPGRPCG